jgi:hypothetical protein
MTDKERARIQPETESTLGFAHRCLGDLHGRNLASALMRSRVHNRTRDRGGEPIRINGGVHCPPVLPEPGRGRSLKGALDARSARKSRCARRTDEYRVTLRTEPVRGYGLPFLLW